MTSLRSRQFAATCLVIAAAFAVSPGCSSSPDAAATVDSMTAFGLEIAKAKDSIDNTVAALRAVVASQPGEINVNVTAYTKTVTNLDAHAKVVRGRAEEMTAKGDLFFKDWEALASVSAERRAGLTASYAKIKTDMTAAREEFTPFLAALKDIDSYLEVDPSPTGIGTITELVRQARVTGASVKTRIDAVLVQVNSVRGMLSTSPK